MQCCWRLKGYGAGSYEEAVSRCGQSWQALLKDVLKRVEAAWVFASGFCRQVPVCDLQISFAILGVVKLLQLTTSLRVVYAYAAKSQRPLL